MKKLLLAVAILASVPTVSLAQHRGHPGHHHHHHGHRGWNWAPFVVGAATGAIIYDIYNRPVVVQQPPVVYQQPQVVYQTQPNCTQWVEVMNPNGLITRTRTCTQ